MDREVCGVCGAWKGDDELIALRQDLAAARARHDACAASNRLHTEEKLKLQADLAAARELLREASGWLGDNDAEESLIRRIDAAIAGEKK